MDRHLTIRDSARALGVHENTIRNWINKGLLKAQRLPSGVRRVPRSEVLEMIESIGAPQAIDEMPAVPLKFIGHDEPAQGA
jgi:excisionase family DNA binding protein